MLSLLLGNAQEVANLSLLSSLCKSFLRQGFLEAKVLAVKSALNHVS